MAPTKQSGKSGSRPRPRSKSPRRGRGAPAGPAAVTSTAFGSSPYIVSARYDWVFFLIPPSFAVLLGFIVAQTFLVGTTMNFHGTEVVPSRWFTRVFTYAHLGIVFFRSHGDAAIRQQYPIRFFVVPVVLWAAMLESLWVLVSVIVLVTFWDVYHSGLQTFGFGRIYDRKAGNDPAVGRRLDWCLAMLLYAGPIVAGASMYNHFSAFGKFEVVESAFFTSIPPFMLENQPYFTWAILPGGLAFLIYYVYAYWRLAQQGYRVSSHKVFLYVTTALCSIVAWGFNPWAQAYFIMNFFHAFQYFGIVWFYERGNMMRLFGLSRVRAGKQLTALLFVSLAFGYGYWAEWVPAEMRWAWALTLVVSIMHFWYDGFIWSVRKRQV